MENIFFIFFVAIVIAMIIAALKQKPNTRNYDRTDGGDYTFIGSDDSCYSHQYGHTDHSMGFDCSSGDSGSCDSGSDSGSGSGSGSGDSGGCDGGGGGGD